MARQFRLPGFREWVGEIQQVTARQAAQDIVDQLIFLGPWYSGQFARNWVARVGDVRIPATVKPENNLRERTPRQVIKPPVVPSLKGTGPQKDVGYTINNRVTYRNIAMDLEPGRVERARFLSAEQDWYRTYIEGGGMRLTLQGAVFAASQDPRIKGFVGKRAGPAGQLVNQVAQS